MSRRVYYCLHPSPIPCRHRHGVGGNLYAFAGCQDQSFVLWANYFCGKLYLLLWPALNGANAPGRIVPHLRGKFSVLQKSFRHAELRRCSAIPAYSLKTVHIGRRFPRHLRQIQSAFPDQATAPYCTSPAPAESHGSPKSWSFRRK